jgi:outer membrane protein
VHLPAEVPVRKEIKEFKQPMKHNYLRYALALAIALPLTAFAQTGAAAPATTGPEPTRVGIINIQAAIVGSNEGQQELEKLKARFEPKQAALEKQAKDIDDLQKQINTQGDKLNDTARQQMRDQLATKQRDYQRAVEDTRSEVQAAQDEMLNKIGNKIMPILDKYAREHGYALILDSSQPFPQGPLLWANVPSVDLTKIITDMYNAQSGVPAPAASAVPSAPKPATRPATNNTPRR